GEARGDAVELHRGRPGEPVSADADARADGAAAGTRAADLRRRGRDGERIRARRRPARGRDGYRPARRTARNRGVEPALGGDREARADAVELDRRRAGEVVAGERDV